MCVGVDVYTTGLENAARDFKGLFIYLFYDVATFEQFWERRPFNK